MKSIIIVLSTLMATSNNVTRLLNAKKIHFIAYELTAEKRGALETANLLGADPKMVYKTIVITRADSKPILAVIPGPNRVDLKSLASVVGVKKVNLPSEREAEKLTGLQAGGISPLALINKGFEVVIDLAAKNFPEIHISGGQRGLNIRLPVNALVELTHARLALVSLPESENLE